MIGMIGAAREIRTPDPLITNEVLYQLSYCGIRSGRRWTCRMQPSGLLADPGTVASERARPSPARCPADRGVAAC